MKRIILASLLLLCLTGRTAAQDLDYERVHNLIIERNDAALDTLLTRWYYSGLYPADVLNYHYNELQGMDLVGKLILQRVLHVHRDKVLLNLNATYDSTYMTTLCQRMEVPVPTESYGDGRFVLMTHWVCEHTGRQVYLSASAMPHLVHPGYLDPASAQAVRIDSVATVLKSHLYNEGLTMRYSTKPYDNRAVKRRNIEKRYRLEYLRMPFHPEIKNTQRFSCSADVYAMNYVRLLHDQLPYYKKYNRERYQWLYDIFTDIIERLDKESYDVDEFKGYLK